MMNVPLTVIAYRNAPVHGEVDDGHDDAQRCQEDPVFAEPRECVPPDVACTLSTVIGYSKRT